MASVETPHKQGVLHRGPRPASHLDDAVRSAVRKRQLDSPGRACESAARLGATPDGSRDAISPTSLLRLRRFPPDDQGALSTVGRRRGIVR